ncbi:uncharacterized protein LOC107884639 [Acyrthosiphon pisum]|uniref:Uncharacterized protein n=1 Tax=Acyrthosiphon pisum TaxID=7029 RepID=A0A8R2H9M9_ACYPI|nr:uncharacterized protein LOC107884639 [Acyrthosiphon pisum]|eukprot:XP_016662685.1 PREDICTED: uncharacterized protein LOC107884639 [Acyrthosiphon pisum]
MKSLIVNKYIASTSEISKKITVLYAIQWLDSAVKLVKRETIKTCFSKTRYFTYDDTNFTNEIGKMDEHVKESIMEMCSIIVYLKTMETMTKKRYSMNKSYR